MKEVIRKGNVLDGKEFHSINAAKKASRELQRSTLYQTRTKVRVVPHKTKTYFPICENFRKPQEIIHIGKEFWDKVKEKRVTIRALSQDWYYARRICRTLLWNK